MPPPSALIFADALMSTMIFVDALMNAICPPVAVIRALRKILMAASLMLSCAIMMAASLMLS